MAKGLCHSLHNREPQAKTSEVRCPRDLVVLLEYTRNILSHDSNAAIPYLNSHLVIDAATPYQNPAFIGISDGVRKQVSHHLIKHPSIASDPKPAFDHAPFQPLVHCWLQKIGGQRREQRIDWKVADRRTKDAGFKPVDVQKAEQHSIHYIHGMVDLSNQCTAFVAVNLF